MPTLPNVTLEPLRMDHARELFLELRHPKLYEFIPQEPPTTMNALEKRYAFVSDPASPPEGETWLNWVVRDLLSEEAVGLVEASIQKDYAAIAYSVFPRFWKRGYAVAACTRMLDVLHLNWGVREARAWVDSRNEASIRLLERLGFERIGFIKAADEFKGTVSDEFEFRLFLTSSYRTPGSLRSEGE